MFLVDFDLLSEVFNLTDIRCLEIFVKNKSAVMAADAIYDILIKVGNELMRSGGRNYSDRRFLRENNCVTFISALYAV